MTTQIAIVGAGLSGSLTAVVLARAGYRVTLAMLDRKIRSTTPACSSRRSVS